MFVKLKMNNNNDSDLDTRLDSFDLRLNNAQGEKSNEGNTIAGKKASCPLIADIDLLIFNVKDIKHGFNSTVLHSKETELQEIKNKKEQQKQQAVEQQKAEQTKTSTFYDKANRAENRSGIQR